MNIKQLLEELKRRNVYKAAVAYLLTSWLILQVASVLFPVFEVANGVMKGLTILLVIGFPLTLLFAWIYEITPEGLKPTSSIDQPYAKNQSTDKILNRMIIGVLLLAVAVLIIDRSRIVFLKGSKNQVFSSSTISEENQHKRITVLSFINQTDSDDLAAYGIMLSDWITRGLMETKDANVVNSANLQHIFGDSQKEGKYDQQFAERSGINLLLQGRYYLAEDRLIVTADITDVTSGKVLRTFQREGARESLMDLLEAVTEDIMSYWAVKDHVQFSQAPPRYEAYEEYLKGLSVYTINAEEAIIHMENAFWADSSFFSPLFRAWSLYRNLGQVEKASVFQNYLTDKKSSFTKFESLHFDGLVATQEHRFFDAAKLNYQKYELDPSDFRANYNAASMYNSANYPKKTLETLSDFDERLLVDHEGVTSWRETLQAFANYRLGNYGAVHKLVGESSFTRMPAALSAFHMLALIRLDSLHLIPFYYEKYTEEGVYGFTGMKGTNDQVLINICSELMVTAKNDLLREYAQKLKDWESRNHVVDVPHDSPDIWNNKPFRQEEVRGYAHFFLGEREDAISAWYKEDIPDSNWPDVIERASRMGHCYATLGDSLNANLQLRQIDSVELDHPELASQKSYYKSRILSALGRHDEAIDEIDNSIRNGLSYFRIFLLDRDPFLLSLSDHPSFQALVRPKG